MRWSWMIIVKDREVSKEGEIYWVLKKQGYQMVREERTEKLVQRCSTKQHIWIENAREWMEDEDTVSESPAPKAEPGAQ